jgi:hypothetical protein
MIRDSTDHLVKLLHSYNMAERGFCAPLYVYLDKESDDVVAWREGRVD